MRLIFFIIILVAQPVFASDYTWSTSCDKSQSTMSNCSKEMLDHYDKKLNILYKEQMKHLNGPYSEGKFKDYLLQAQRAWVEFRDKDCTYYAGTREDSGSIWPMKHNICLANRTKTRVEELKQYVECRANGCPY